MTFLDTGVLVGALLERHPDHDACFQALVNSLHATFARRQNAKRILTPNPSHFGHAAPDLEILTP